MFLASDVIKCHFGAHTESQESSSSPLAKHFLCLCLAKICLKSTSSSSFSGFSSAYVIPISPFELSSSFDNAITMTRLIKRMHYTRVMSSPIVFPKPFISPKPVMDSCNLSRKRKSKRFGSSSDVSLDNMWAEFQCLWASRMSSSSWSPKSDQLIVPGLLPLPIRLFIISRLGETNLLFLPIQSRLWALLLSLLLTDL